MSSPEDRSDGPPGDLRAAARPSAGRLQRLNRLLTSPKLAIALLVAVLACSIVGVTVVRGARAGALIFGTLWFNALLVLLAVSSFAAFFSRIWKRKLTLVSAGMILFHLSFAAMLGGIVWNQLFFFRGVLRLTEGETLPNDRPESYDWEEHGRLFDFRTLRGQTKLVKMQRDVHIGGGNKQAAYDIEVTRAGDRTRTLVYTTEYLHFHGIRFFRMKEGYTVLLVLSGKEGIDLFGAYVPLQSYRIGEHEYRYASGSAFEEYPFTFPPPPQTPRADVHVSYRPSTVREREGEVEFKVTPLGPSGAPAGKQVEGRTVVGAPFQFGELTLTPREIRYWVGMDVKYDPGQSVIFASLCFGVSGMIVTFLGRMRQGTRQARPAGAGQRVGAGEETA